MWFLFTQTETLDFLSQIVKIFSEDGMGKVVEIPANMTARDLCQLLVYKSHCVDDNSWALVEHHPLLGLGKEQSCRSLKHSQSHTQTHIPVSTHEQAHFPTQKPMGSWVGSDLQFNHWVTGALIFMHACMHACPYTWLDSWGADSYPGVYSSMSAC